MKITKRNGTITVYDDEKVTKSILNANAASEGDRKLTKNEAGGLAYIVFNRLIAENEIITTREIRECVCAVLRDKGFPNTAKEYAEYKKL